MKVWLYSLAATLLMLSVGLVHGYWTDRWITDDRLSSAAERLNEIPMQIGEWVGKEIETRPGQAGAGVTGCVQRSYHNARLGATVVIALVNGRPGPIATHTPEACYGASGYTVGKRTAVPLEKGSLSSRFWTADAVRTRVAEVTKVRLFWAWNGGQEWVASEDARREFSRFRYPVLHKLYVLRDLTGSPLKDRPVDAEEPCVLFLETLLPVLQKTLFVEDA